MRCVLVLFAFCFLAPHSALTQIATYDLQLINKRFQGSQMLVDLEVRSNQAFILGGPGKDKSVISIDFEPRGTGPGEIVPDSASNSITGYDMVLQDDTSNNFLVVITQRQGSYELNDTFEIIGTLYFTIGAGSNDQETVSMLFDTVSTTVTNDKNKVQNQGEFTGFSNAPLPVTITNIHLENHQNELVLKWITRSESNNLGFEFQMSRDGEYFTTSQWIGGKGNSASESRYEVAFKQEDYQYARLKQLDMDGNEHYSRVLRIADYVSSTPTKISRNQNQLILSAGNKSELSWRMFSMNGQLVNNGKDRRIDLSTLHKGVYILKLSNSPKSAYRFAIQ